MNAPSSPQDFGIGRPVCRVEGARFLTGRGRFVGDLTLPRQHVGVVLMSPHPTQGLRGSIPNLHGMRREHCACLLVQMPKQMASANFRRSTCPRTGVVPRGIARSDQFGGRVLHCLGAWIRLPCALPIDAPQNAGFPREEAAKANTRHPERCWERACELAGAHYCMGRGFAAGLIFLSL
jgi:hypothetical protein